MSERSEEYRKITALFVAGKLDEGIQSLENAKNSLPRSEFIECSGNLHFYKREFQEACDLYEKAMMADPDYDVCRYHYLIGVQEERHGEPLKAFERYQASIEIDPTFVDAYIELGGLLAKAEDYEGALTCYTDALRLDRNDLRIFANRAEILLALSIADPTRHFEYLAALSEYTAAKARLPAIDERYVW